MSQQDDQRIVELLEGLSQTRPPDLDDAFAEELFEHLQEDVSPISVRRRPPSHRQRGLRSTLASRPILAAGVSFVLLVVIGFAGSLLGGGEDQSQSATTTPTGTSSLLPATFADGRSVVLLYPSKLKLDSMSVSSSVRLRLESGDWRGCGALMEIGTGDRTAEGGSLIRAYESGANRTELWTTDGPASEILVFTGGRWQGSIPFSVGDGCPPEQLAPIWTELITLSEDENGFPNVLVDEPAVFDRDYIGGSGLPQLEFQSTEGVIELTSQPCDASEQAQSQGEFLGCLGEDVAVLASGSDAFLTLASRLKVESATTSEEPTTFVDYLREMVGGVGLKPQSRIEGDRSLIDLTFTDGRRVHILYPAEWPLDEYGWTPSTDVVYDLEEQRQDGTGFLYAQVVLTYGADEDWSVHLEPQSIWTNSELALALSHIQVNKEENGFVTITTTRPFAHYTQDPSQSPLADDFKGRTPWVDVGDILGLTSTPNCFDGPVTETNNIMWCDEDAGVIFGFTAPETYHDEILDNVDARLVSAGQGG